LIHVITTWWRVGECL